MQQPRCDKSEAQRSLPKVREMLYCYVAVVDSSAFKMSLKKNKEKLGVQKLTQSSLNGVS